MFGSNWGVLGSNLGVGEQLGVIEQFGLGLRGRTGTGCRFEFEGNIKEKSSVYRTCNLWNVVYFR